jgi:DNA-binding transcriptional ArsR family regulator
MTTAKKALPKKMDRAALDRLAEVFRAFADATRLALLQELKEGPKNVNQLLAAIGTTQANVSRQLKVLHAAGLLMREESGPFVRYSIADEVVMEMCNAACRKLSKAVTPSPIPEFFI